MAVVSVAKRRLKGTDCDLYASFLLLVGEGLPDAVARRICIVGKPELVVSVVGNAAPKSDCVNHGTGRAPLAFAHEFGLMRVDAGVVVFTIDSGNVVERIVLCERETEEALIENVRGSHRRAVTLRRRIWLVAIEIGGLCRVGRVCRVGRWQIRVIRYAIVLRRATEGIGMHGEVSASRVQQYGAIETAVDRSTGTTEFGTDAAVRDVGRNSVVG